MKRSLILGCALMLAAAPLYAAVQPGQVTGPNSSRGHDGAPSQIGDAYQLPSLSPMPDQDSGPVDATVQPSTDEPTRPVPEPGTMAMASMGLMALGATLRRRRAR
jgi:hypothetical protein